MRVPLGWLAEWIELPASVDALVDRLTEAGLEVEEILRTGPDLSGVRVGQVLERARHADADRLSVCRVDIGGGESLEIVCGAPNVAAGQKVAVAVAGTELPGGLRIKKSKIRGVVSSGMICSARELGLAEDAGAIRPGADAAGILVLDPAAPVGAPLPSVLPTGETVLDVEITPNRGDWVSLLGMAREVRASFGGTLRMPETQPPETGAPVEAAIRISVEDRAGCARYVARVVRGVRVGPSPAWLAKRIEAAGFRSVNNVVDVTNLVMLELGQPLHAFDLAKLRGGLVRVRAAEPGEKIRTLDGHLRELARGDLMIADAEGAIAVAGVMGGAESEVGEHTRDLLLESAYFEPARVRRTARRLGLASDASYRFERGVDPDGQRRAVDRAARLIAEVAGGEVAPGAVEASGDPVPPAEPIALAPARVNRLLGTSLAPGEIQALLERVEVACDAPPGGALRCRPPRHRPDLRIAADLVEEVARIHGYDRIPSTLPGGAIEGVSFPPRRATREAVRSALVAAGLSELMTLPFVGSDDVEALRLAEGDPRRRSVRVVNPMQAERPWLRTQLVSSLLRAAQLNRARQVGELRCFELARVFRAGEPGALPDEPIEAVALLAPGEAATLWAKQRPPVFFEAKGVAERLLGELGVAARFAGGEVEPFLHPGAAGEFRVGRRRAVTVGELHPELRARFELDGPIALVSVDVDALDGAEREPARVKEPSRFPSVERDLAVLLAAEVAAGEVAEALREAGGASLQSVAIFDRFAGPGVPQGKVSVAFRLRFQRPDRTLTEAEVSEATERAIAMLARRFGGELRERAATKGEGS
jgi:phenylalanyl-tRNA synthetase beta chain